MNEASEMIAEFKSMMSECLADDEFFDMVARVMKKAHDSMVKAGFSSDQATAMLAGRGVNFTRSGSC